MQAADLPIIFLADKCWCLFKAAAWMEGWDVEGEMEGWQKRSRRNRGDVAGAGLHG